MRKSLLGCLVFALACGGDATHYPASVSPGAAIDGVYTLSTINGAPLPFTDDTSGGRRHEVMSGTIQVTRVTSATGGISFTTRTRSTYPGLPTVTATETNQYDVAFTGDRTFTFRVVCVTPQSSCSRSGTVDGLTLTVQGVNGTSWRYTR